MDGFFRHVKSKHQQPPNVVASSLSSPQTCQVDSDCLGGYFCKNSDCVAKRAEGSLCLSGRNEECLCGRCSLNQETWERFCIASDSCSNDGKNQHNANFKIIFSYLNIFYSIFFLLFLSF